MKFEETQVSDNELEFLKKLAGTNKTIIEIGVFAGKVSLSLESQGNTILSIDPYIAYDDQATKFLQDAEKIFNEKRKNKRIVHIKETSENALNYYEGYKDKVDGIFIDGDHNYESVKKDIEWIKYIKKGGWIAFHDYPWIQFGVKQAVDELVLNKYELIGTENSIIAFRI